jgi:N-acylneuraminate cytidylyltransferase
MSPFVLGAIFARGGSKRVPRKNLRPLAGKPLIAHTIEAARASAHIERVVVSTDDDEIAEVSEEWGAEVPFRRPADLAGDDAPEHMAWQHAITEINANPDFAEIRAFVCLPTTAPLRAVEDVDRCIGRFLEGDADIVITVASTKQSPYYNMVVLDGEGYARKVIESPATVSRRQAFPEVFAISTVAYAADPQFVLDSVTYFDGRIAAVEVPEERSLDIDTEADLEYADYVLSRRAGVL